MIKIATGLIIAFLLLILFTLTSDIPVILQTFKKINVVYLIPAVALYLISLWVRSFRWKYLLMLKSGLDTPALFQVVCVGYMANNLLPFRIGEFIRSYYLSKKSNSPIGVGLSSIMLEHLLDAITLLFLVIVTGPFVPLADTLKQISAVTKIEYEILIILCTSPFIVASMLTLSITYFHETTLRIVSQISIRFPNKFDEKIKKISEDIVRGLSSIKSWRYNKVMMITSIPIWVLEALSFHFVGLSLGLQNAFDGQTEMFLSNLLMTSITNIGSSIPASPGGTGIFEFVCRETLLIVTNYQVPRATGSVFAITLHACLMLPTIILGQIFLLKDGLSFYQLYRSKPIHDAKQDTEDQIS